MTKKTEKRMVRIFAGILVFLAVFLTVTFSHFSKYTNAFIARQTDQKLEEYSAQQIKYIETVLDGQFAALESMAAFLGGSSRASTEDFSELAASVEAHMAFSRIIVADCDGASLTSDGMIGNQADCAYFQTALAGFRAISEPLVSDFDQDYTCVVLAVPLKTPDGAICGVLSGSYTAERFGALLMENNYWENADSFFADVGGRVIVSSVDGEIRFDNAAAGMEPVLLDGVTDGDVLAAMAGGSSMVFRAQSGGADYYVTVMPFGYNGWSFVSVTETAEADANYAFIRQNTKWLNIAIALAFLACLAVVVPVLLSSQRKLRAEADKQRSRARTDVMTGLYNKAAAEAAAKRALLEDEQRIDALVICDLDGLKSINDSCGHAEGDRAICALADCIHARFRASDVLGRIGGDEFLILLRDIDGETQARGALESLQQSVSGCRIGGDPARPLCVSLGACLTAGGEGYAEVCRRADTALYYVKQNGKNGLAFYTPDMPPIGGRESD